MIVVQKTGASILPTEEASASFHPTVVQLLVLTAEKTQTVPTLAAGDFRTPRLTASPELVKQTNKKAVLP